MVPQLHIHCHLGRLDGLLEAACLVPGRTQLLAVLCDAQVQRLHVLLRPRLVLLRASEHRKFRASNTGYMQYFSAHIALPLHAAFACSQVHEPSVAWCVGPHGAVCRYMEAGDA